MPSFLKTRALEMFTESDGKLSLSRVSSGAIVLSTLVWGFYLVFKTKSLPDLTGPSLFISGGGLHYGIGKFFGNKNGSSIPDVKLPGPQQ